MKKEFIYAAIGGCIGAILTSIFNLFSPLNAQDIPPDVTFGKITCKELHVQDPLGTTNITGGAIYVSGHLHLSPELNSGLNRPKHVRHPHRHALSGVTQILGGYIGVSPLEDKYSQYTVSKRPVSKASMFCDKNGGRVLVEGTLAGPGLSLVDIKIAGHGGYVSLEGQDGESEAVMYIDEYGGNLDLYGNNSNVPTGGVVPRVMLSVTKKGDGVVNLFDKQGLLTTPP